MLKARQFRSPIIVALMGDALLLRGGEQNSRNRYGLWLEFFFLGPARCVGEPPLKLENQNRLLHVLHGWVDDLASGCVFKKCCTTCIKVDTCSLPRH